MIYAEGCNAVIGGSRLVVLSTAMNDWDAGLALMRPAQQQHTMHASINTHPSRDPIMTNASAVAVNPLPSSPPEVELLLSMPGTEFGPAPMFVLAHATVRSPQN